MMVQTNLLRLLNGWLTSSIGSYHAIKMKIPTVGIMVDAAHSVKHQKTEFQGKLLETGERIFYQDLGFQTVNIGEFLAIVTALKWAIETDYSPKVIYSDSQTALSWIKAKRTASNKPNKEIKKAEIFLQVFDDEISKFEFHHWNNSVLGENIADFGNK